MKTCIAAPALALMLLTTAQAASPAICELAPGERLSSPRFELSYRAIPERIAIGSHFTLDVSACPRAGSATPELLRVDATMPEHRHGMNYKASVGKTSSGRFRAEGLMFHMAGRWELVFELQSGGVTERLSRSIVIE